MNRVVKKAARLAEIFDFEFIPGSVLTAPEKHIVQCIVVFLLAVFAYTIKMAFVKNFYK